MFDVHGFELTVFKLLIGVTLIVLHLRLTGKQRTVQLTPIDFIGNFILGGVIGGVILQPRNLVRGVHQLPARHLWNHLRPELPDVEFMSTRSLVMGKAYTIIEGGRFSQDALDSTDHKLDPVEFLAELRGMGIFSLSDISLVQREANGSLTVRRKGEGGINYVLVSSGQIVTDNLKLAHRDEEWLRAELSSAGVGDLEDLFVVELDANNRLNIVSQTGNTTAMTVSEPAINEVTMVTEFENPETANPTLEDFAGDPDSTEETPAQ